MKKKKNILLIDDDEVFIFLTSKMLESSGIAGNIHVSGSAIDAINYLEFILNDKAPDIILLDLNMPEMNGWEFLQHYQSILPKLKSTPTLYVVSSSIANNDTERALNIRGVTGYIAKPMNEDLLKNILKMA